MSSIENYVSKFRTYDDVEFTHVSREKPTGKFNIGFADIEDFWKVFCDSVHSGKAQTGLSEMRRDYSMLVVDCDLKKLAKDVAKDHPECITKVKDVNKDGDEIEVIKYNPVRLYTDKHVEGVIRAYQMVMAVQTKDWNPSMGTVILLEKDPYMSKDYIKSGFHLAFIRYFPSKILMDSYIIPKIVESVTESGIFNDLQLGIPVDKILDVPMKGTKFSPWLLYGAQKEGPTGVYKVSKAYKFSNVGPVQVSIEEAFEGYELFDSRGAEIKWQENFEWHLPRLLSVHPSNRKVVEIIPIFEGADSIHISEEENEVPETDASVEQKLHTAAELLNLISIDRACSRNGWIEIGWILFSISRGSRAALKLWMNFSSQIPVEKYTKLKYSQEACLTQWATMRIGNYTMGTLRHYAKTDSPDKYKKFTESRLDVLLRKAASSAAHYDIARILFELYSTQYVCASIKRNEWYFFEDHHWQEMEEGIELQKKISVDLAGKFFELIKQDYERLLRTSDDNEAEKKQIQGRIDSTGKLIKKLKDTPFKKNVMVQCRELFYEKSFLNRLGRNKYLLVVKNGVYDLIQGALRNGKPEDYLYFAMNISYIEHTEEDPNVIETNRIFSQIFPDISIREYFLDRLAEMLVGGNKRKHLYFWTGRSNGGKSVVKSFIEKMFGPYSIDMPNSVLVGMKPKTGQACPELARSGRGVRVAFTQEPNKKDVINTGSAKEYSGNDTFYTRGLYVEGGEIDPLFKLVLICNDLPQVSANDPAYWGRCRVLLFESLFSMNAPESEEEQIQTKHFPRDDTITEKLETLIESLFWILTERLKDIGKTINEPAKVLQATQKYQTDQDVFVGYIDERIVNDASKCVDLHSLYISFRDWFRISYNGEKCPTKKDVKDYFLDHWGDFSKGAQWNGKRLRNEQDDVAEGIAEEIPSTHDS